jgi:hypothetical protein
MTVSSSSTLAEPISIAGERRSWWVRTCALALLFAFALAGLLGVWGVHSATVTATSAGGLTVRVTYPNRTRPALAVPFSIVVTRPGGFDSPIEVATSTHYLAAFDENGTNPAPDRATTDAEHTTWTYDPPPGDTLTVWLDTRIEPGVQWRRRGTTVVRTGGDEVRVHYTSWIFP